MKQHTSFSTALLLYATLLVGCKREIPNASPFTGTQNLAYLKLVHAAPFFRNTTGMQDTFNIYINGNKINGAAFSYGSVFPMAGTNTYLALQPGMQQIRLSVPGVVNTDSITILSLAQNCMAGKYYTLLLTDSIKAARDSAVIFVKDSLATPAPGFVNIRFIHAVLNDTAGKTVDLFSFAKNANLLSNIKPDSISAFQSVGFNSQTPDTLYVKRSGTSQVLAKFAFSAATIVAAPQRNYTLYYRGDATATTGPKARALTGFVQ